MLKKFFEKYSALQIGIAIIILAAVIAFVITATSPLLLFKAMFLFLFIIMTKRAIHKLNKDSCSKSLFYSWVVVAFLFSIVVYL